MGYPLYARYDGRGNSHCDKGNRLGNLLSSFIILGDILAMLARYIYQYDKSDIFVSAKAI